jgi:hypothetical protein
MQVFSWVSVVAVVGECASFEVHLVGPVSLLAAGVDEQCSTLSERSSSDWAEATLISRAGEHPCQWIVDDVARMTPGIHRVKNKWGLHYIRKRV